MQCSNPRSYDKHCYRLWTSSIAQIPSRCRSDSQWIQFSWESQITWILSKSQWTWDPFRRTWWMACTRTLGSTWMMFGWCLTMLGCIIGKLPGCTDTAQRFVRFDLVLSNENTELDFLQLSEVFEQEIDPVMQALGYCCGRKYTFNPQVLCCYGKQLCTIPRDAKYFSYQNRWVIFLFIFHTRRL